MKNILKAVCALSLISAFPTAAAAQDNATAVEQGLKIDGNFGFISDYRWRGTSLSNNNFAIQGGFSTGKGGFYTGIWASNFSNLGNGDNIEIDFYGGYAFDVAEGLNLNLGAKYVAFPGVDDSSFLRVSGSATVDVGKGKVSLGADYEPEQNDTFLDAGDNHYLYATANYPLAFSGLSLNARIGREDGQFADEKIDWLLGVSKEIVGLSWSLQYVDTNKSGDQNSATAVLGVSKGF